MKFIAHRINTVAELKEVPTQYGIELDLRDYENRLVLQHDPFQDGEEFDDYLKHYRHGTIILNVKSERIEYQVLELLQKHKIEDYFFLDSSFPMIHLLSAKGERSMALRFSEWEGLDTLRAMKGRVDWVWVDCFTRIPLDAKLLQEIKTLGYRTCFVSPELQGRPEDIPNYIQQLEEEGIVFDAICTKLKNIPQWQKNSPVYC